MFFDLFKRKSVLQTADSLYRLLTSEKYAEHPYETNDLGEGMAVVEEVMNGWWKPRFLINHNTKCAYEFMNEAPVEMAQRLSFHFPSFIRRFENGVAEVSWQLCPEGRYYMDEDGYGMTDDEEIEIYGYIDQNAKVVVKFRNVDDLDELDEMQRQAEEKVRISE